MGAGSMSMCIEDEYEVQKNSALRLVAPGAPTNHIIILSRSPQTYIAFPPYPHREQKTAGDNSTSQL